MLIENLTSRQVELLDKMWNIDSEHQLNEWRYTLNDLDLIQVDALRELLRIECIDQSVMDFSDAIAYMKGIM